MWFAECVDTAENEPSKIIFLHLLMFAHPQIPEYEYDIRVLRCSPAKRSTARTPQAARTAPAGRRGSHTPSAGRRPAQVPSAPGCRFSQVSKWKYTKQARYQSTKGSQSIKLSGKFGYSGRANCTGLVLECIEIDFCNRMFVWKLSLRSKRCTPLYSPQIAQVCHFLPKYCYSLAFFC